MTESNEICANADRSGRAHRDGDDVVVRLARLAGNHARPLQVLHAQRALLADDGRQLVTCLALVRHLLRLDRVGRVQPRVVVGRHVEVLAALLGRARRYPRWAVDFLHLVGESDTRTAVRRNVESRNSTTTCQFGRLAEHNVLFDAKRSHQVRDVVGNDYLQNEYVLQ